jgi:phosphatidylinositol alpha-1,6-mannosyltransferase
MTTVSFITRNFPPLVGGMERLSLESVRALAEEWSVELVGPHGAQKWAPDNCSLRAVPYRSAIGFLAAGWRQARRLSRETRHVIVIGGSGLAAPLVRAAAGDSAVRTACFVHGLDLVVAQPVYRGLCLPALRAMDFVIANSRNTAVLAEQTGIDRERIEILNPGVAVESGSEASAFLDRFPQAKRRPILLSVGRLLPRKGVVDFVREVLPAVLAKRPDALLVVAGDAAPSALTGASGEARRLAEAIESKGLHDSVLLTGRLDDDVLDALYSAARLLVFPVRDIPGDVEGFGMVALEAAAHGLPTVAFDVGGVADAVADGCSGTLISPGDYARMASVVQAYLQGAVAGVDADSCRRHAAAFAWPIYGEKLRDLVRRRMGTVTSTPT